MLWWFLDLVLFGWAGDFLAFLVVCRFAGSVWLWFVVLRLFVWLLAFLFGLAVLASLVVFSGFKVGVGRWLYLVLGGCYCDGVWFS